MILAMGVTLQGEKIVLGMVESYTENHRVCQAFLQRLKERGLSDEERIPLKHHIALQETMSYTDATDRFHKFLWPSGDTPAK